MNSIKSHGHVWAFAIALGLAIGVGLATQASAQYPPPQGGVFLTTADATPGIGAEVTVEATVQDESGAPLSGADCTFYIAQQPGDDATVDPGPFATDSDGTAATTLNTGSTEGLIVVGVDCGELSAQVTIAAGEAAAPPASLPDTGSGGTAATSSALWAVLALVATLGLGSLAFAWRRTRA